MTAPSLEVPHWMFDRARCISMRLAESAVVSTAALMELKALLSAATRVAVLEDQDLFPPQPGDPDAKVPSQQTDAATAPVSPQAERTDLARAIRKNTTPGSAVAGPAASERRHTKCVQQKDGGAR